MTSWRRGSGRWPFSPAGIKRTARRGAGVVVALLALLGPASPAWAQAPDEDWRTLETEHFRVTFPEHLEGLGRAAADRAERAWRALEEHFIDPPESRVDLLVTDHTDVTNGYAVVTPSNRIVVFARPPVDALALGFVDEWLELVITHELVHIVHLDHVVNPIGRLGRAIFGRVPAEWPVFPELGTPRWVIEGIATWYESRLTEAGRTRGSFFDMQLRTAALEGELESIGQAGGESPEWPGGNRSYLYGSLFFDYLLERHGEESMEAFVDAVGGQWIPYRMDAAAKDAFGVSFSEAWGTWRDSVQADVATLDGRLEALGPITEPEALTRDARWALYPTVSPDGRYVAYTRSDGYSDMQIRLIDMETGESRSLGRTNQLATFSWIDAERMLVSQLELQGPYRYYSDLYVFDLEGGQTRLTEGARLTQPSVSADGSWAVAVREGGGTNELVRFDLETREVVTLVGARPDVHWASPAVSPDGRWVAATRFEPDARHDVVVLDARSGEVVDRVTDDRALDLAPRWSPDGRRIVWASDRSAIFNAYAVDVDPDDGTTSGRVMLTNVRTGVAYPSVDPAGAWLYVSGYHADGWEVERVPFTPVDGRPVPSLAQRFVPDGPRPDRGPAAGTVEPYSAGPTLRPTYWEISYEDALETPAVVTSDGGEEVFLRRRELLGPALGVQTSGRDLVGRHAYSAYLRVTTKRAEVDGGFSYSWAGLGNPVLSLSGSQSFSDGGQQIARPDPAAPPDTLFTLERQRFVQGAVTFSAPTWRWGRSATVGTGLVWEDRELLGRDLEPTDEYRLLRPGSRLWDASLSLSLNSTRSHSFQLGISEGLGLFLQGRIRRELSLPDSLRSVVGRDRSTGEVLGRVRGGIPLWKVGYARHVIAFQATGGMAGGPGAGPFQFRVGGASGQPEPVTGLELFGGRFFFFPVRGYEPSTRFGRYAWTASAEYRIPLWLVNEGLGAWPLHFDRTMASVFFDVGNAWGPETWPTGFANPLRSAVASVGAELTAGVLSFFDIGARIRGGVAFPLVATTAPAGEPRFYVRVGLPY